MRGKFYIISIIFFCLSLNFFAASAKKTILVSEELIVKEKKNIQYGSVFRMIQGGDKNFFLDPKTSQVIAFNVTEILYSFGKKGQGPGDLVNPRALDLYANNIYVLHDLGRVEVFSEKGDYLSTIALEKKHIQYSGSGFCIAGNKVYFAPVIGRNKLIRFSMDGKWEKDLIADGDSIVPGTAVYSELNQVYIDEKLKQIYLMSSYNGIIEIYNMQGEFKKEILCDPNMMKRGLKKAWNKTDGGQGGVRILAFDKFDFFVDRNERNILVFQRGQKRDNKNIVSLFAYSLDDQRIEELSYVCMKERFVDKIGSTLNGIIVHDVEEEGLICLKGVV